MTQSGNSDRMNRIQQDSFYPVHPISPECFNEVAEFFLNPVGSSHSLEDLALNHVTKVLSPLALIT
ncbi:MAG: hypothetical protein M2R45_02979 [Verrucomicrobia subdivision 3 bacterium]|nr:hypothetical protein [Limisphaerales bacterium]MCS1416534.1 hypothetical protein [Limisphaerales bacterium]